MAGEQENIETGRKPYHLWLVYILALVLTSSAIYLMYPGLDTAPQPASLADRSANPVPSAKLQPGIVAPSFDVVSADGSGMLVAAGKAGPGSTVLLQNGGETLGTAKADEHGDWVLALERALPAGTYALSLLSTGPQTGASVPGERVFALTVEPHGKTTPQPARTAPAAPQSNSATPGYAAELTAVPANAGTGPQPGKPAKLAAVRRGDTLWRLARHYYGKGIRYGEIAGANKEQIKDPNLIFPNQQLAIPH